MPLFSTAPKSVCFLRLSAIGDVCHAVAAVQALQKHWPETKVTWIIGKVEAQLLDGLEGVELVVFDKKAGWQGIKSVWKALKGRKFDALIHMQLALRASIVTLGIKARYKIGFNRKRAKEGQWLFTNRKIPDTQSEHVLDSFFSFIEYLGVPRTKPSWKLPISSADLALAQSVISNKPTLIISPAASKDERNWLTELYAEFSDWAQEQGYQVVLCGSPAQREVKLAEDIQAIMKHSVINMVGKTSLKQLTALIGAADIILAPDSGPAHIATTQGTPVIGLYGHSNPKRTGPYNSQRYVVSVYEQFAELQYNKPVNELSWSSRVKGSEVMSAISLESVQSKFNSIADIKDSHARNL
ncbi:glycosyltransferase family 9 protein [Vibrio sp. SCSIO 43137]|uniref:glycosyltransferase family 9 protein n=1 Tax=Vibrio sp. SCSIO 43137 TaxID=3021011 RepID=UPI0023078894|nr:glycosyltransferase family 9 protein [Vibrio sp. SCSIO 43137]WCE29840.1 glycosyltransferase family 9 protein [Vibrio sp. SCSIO 43137]